MVILSFPQKLMLEFYGLLKSFHCLMIRNNKVAKPLTPMTTCQEMGPTALKSSVVRLLGTGIR